MSNFKKKIAALGAAVVMSVSCMSVGASAASYSLRYTSGASSSDNVMSYTKVVTASSAGKITFKSTTFSVYITGAYVYIYCYNYSTNSSNVNSTGKYYLNYSGSTVPKSGKSVTVKGSLTNYSVSKTVKAKGTITA